MGPASTSEEFASWTAEGHALDIRYRIDVLRAIASRAAEGFAKIPRGGIEVGGVLFGRRERRDRITIEAWREVECSYRNGPSFELDEADEMGLRRVLEQSADDPDLDGLEPVGWWHSHTRSDIFLSDRDLALQARYFPAVWQVAAVLRPARLEATRIGFFFREADGSIHADRSYREFTLPRRGREAMAERHVHATLPAPAEAENLPAIVPSEPVAMAAPAAAPVRRRALWPVYTGVCLLAIAAALAWVLWPAPQMDLGLRINGTGEVLSIEWQPSKGAKGADVEIREGSDPPRYVHLDARQFAAGRLHYVRVQAEVSARMRVYGWGDDAKDFHASFLGQPVRQPDGPSTLSVPQAEPQRPAAQTTVNVEPGERNETRAALPVEPAVTPPQRPAFREMRMPAAQTASEAASRPQSAGAPPQIAVSPTLEPPAPFRAPIVQPPAPQQPQPRRRTPSVGRAIWTGELRPGAVLSFQGDRPSFGSISGRMPAGPARVMAHAAELGDGAIVVYSADPKYRDRRDTFESPSAKNGWNLTTYRWDPKRAADLAIVESPGPANSFGRLSVRTGGRKLSVIVLDWEELPPGDQ